MAIAIVCMTNNTAMARLNTYNHSLRLIEDDLYCSGNIKANTSITKVKDKVIENKVILVEPCFGRNFYDIKARLLQDSWLIEN